MRGVLTAFFDLPELAGQFASDAEACLGRLGEEFTVKADDHKVQLECVDVQTVCEKLIQYEVMDVGMTMYRVEVTK